MNLVDLILILSSQTHSFTFWLVLYSLKARKTEGRRERSWQIEVLGELGGAVVEEEAALAER